MHHLAETESARNVQCTYYDVDVHNAIFPSPTFPSRARSASTNPSICTERKGMESSPRSTIATKRLNIRARAIARFEIASGAKPPPPFRVRRAKLSALRLSSLHRVSQKPVAVTLLNIAAPVGT